MPKNARFVTRVLCALRGIGRAWATERNMRLHAAALLALVMTLALLRASPLWWAILLLCAVLVIAAELLNTAIEHLADALHPEHHPLIGTAKDCAAGAVLVISVGAVVLFVLFLLDRMGVGRVL
jgi:diacylglycerol kinase (ATP)